MDASIKKQILAMIDEKGADIADEIYDFFLKSGNMAKIFRNTNLDNQKERLVEGLHTIVTLSDDSHELAAYLKDLGFRHLSYEVEDEHYPIIAKALADVLGKYGKQYAIDQDWLEFSEMITGVMQSGTSDIKLVV